MLDGSSTGITGLICTISYRKRDRAGGARRQSEVQEGEVRQSWVSQDVARVCSARVAMKLLPQTAHIAGGRILVDGADITNYREREMEKLRGNVFSMVFQDPMTSSIRR